MVVYRHFLGLRWAGLAGLRNIGALDWDPPVRWCNAMTNTPHPPAPLQGGGGKELSIYPLFRGGIKGGEEPLLVP